MTTTALQARRSFLLDFSPGALEALKWLALALMVIDHINAYLWAWQYPALYALGRLTFPLFAFVLAYNLARPGNEGAADRTLIRLLIFGVAAQAFSMSLRKSVMPADSAWWMLNVMFTFAAAVMLIQATRGSARWYAWMFTMLALVVIGALVEFHWSGVAYMLAAYHFCERRTWPAAAIWIASAAALWTDNGNGWALAAVPLIFIASQLPMPMVVPRLKWGFYIFYPAHLVLLWLLKRAA